MNLDINSNEINAAKWAETFSRLEQAEAVYQEVKAACETLHALQEAFEARHGLIAPGVGRNGTPNYFEKRRVLFEAHPHYKVPDAISDTLEKLTEAVCDIETELFQLPAPDLKALHWKLARTAVHCWSDEYVEQMKIDMDVLLLSNAA